MDNPLTRFLPGLPRWLPLDQIRQVGDVILVDKIDSLSENFIPEDLIKLSIARLLLNRNQLGEYLGFLLILKLENYLL